MSDHYLITKFINAYMHMPHSAAMIWFIVVQGIIFICGVISNNRNCCIKCFIICITITISPGVTPPIHTRTPESMGTHLPSIPAHAGSEPVSSHMAHVMWGRWVVWGRHDSWLYTTNKLIIKLQLCGKTVTWTSMSGRHRVCLPDMEVQVTVLSLLQIPKAVTVANFNAPTGSENKAFVWMHCFCCWR